MDSNKDEAGKCIRIAEQAIASGDKERALKFLKIALRLNDSLQVDELLAGCEKLDSDSPTFIDKIRPNEKLNESAEEKFSAGLNGEHNYTEQHVQLIGHINRNKDYYGILGVEKNCSVDEIKKAYRKLSLKVHPDKNKTPGSEEAFKKVVKAFKCLSDVDSRRQYDHTGLIEEDEYNHQYNVRRRRRRTGHYSYDADFDADELFRAFFGQSDMFPAGRAYRTGGMGSQRREESTGGSPNFFILLQLLPFLLMFLLAYLHFSEPDYSLHQTYSYSVPMMSEKHGVEFYVKSSTFDSKYPLGSSARSDIENNVIRDYKNLLGRYCHAELQRRTWRRNLPTPHCDKLRNLGLA